MPENKLAQFMLHKKVSSPTVAKPSGVRVGLHSPLVGSLVRPPSHFRVPHIGVTQYGCSAIQVRLLASATTAGDGKWFSNRLFIDQPKKSAAKAAPPIPPTEQAGLRVALRRPGSACGDSPACQVHHRDATASALASALRAPRCPRTGGPPARSPFPPHFFW